MTEHKPGPQKGSSIEGMGPVTPGPPNVDLATSQAGKPRFSLLRNISVVSASTYFAEGLFFLRGLLLARLIGPELFGVWASMRLVRNLARYVPLGSVQGMLQLLPHTAATGDAQRAERYRDTAVVFGSALTALFSFMIVLWVWFVQRPEGQWWAWVVFAGVLVVLQFYQLYASTLLAEQRFHLASSAEAGMALLSTTLGLTGALIFGLTGFLAGLAAGHLIVLGAILLFTGRIPISRLHLGTAVELIKTGFPIVTARLLHTVMWNVDKLLVWSILGQRALGFYAIPWFLINTVQLMPSAVATVLYPRLREAIGRTGSLDATRLYLERTTGLIGLITCPILGLLYLTFHLPIQWWLPDYTAAIAPGRILFLVSFFPIVSVLPSVAMIAIGAQRTLIVLRLFAIAVAVTAIAGVLYFNGSLSGVALATIPGFALQSLLTLIAALKSTAVTMARRLRIIFQTMLPFLVLLALLAAAGDFSAAKPDDPGRGLLETCIQVVIICGSLSIWAAWAAWRQGWDRTTPGVQESG